MYRVQVSSFEGLCAVIPHAGICEGAVGQLGQLAVLPRLKFVFFLKGHYSFFIINNRLTYQ
jgi:hypothetical protein